MTWDNLVMRWYEETLAEMEVTNNQGKLFYFGALLKGESSFMKN